MFLHDNNKTALILKNKKITYKKLLEKVEIYSKLFSKKKNQKIIIFSENCLEWIYAFYASWKNQSIVVPVDFMATAEEVAYIIKDSKPEVIFCSKQTEEILKEAVKKSKHKAKVLVFEKIKEKILVSKTKKFDFPHMNENETAIILYTSGTTGSPKGVMLSFDNLIVNIEAVSEKVKIYTPHDRVMILLPLHHIFPLMGSLIGPMANGATVAICPTLVTEDIIQTLQENKITMMIGVPRLYNLIRKGIMDKINSSFVTKSIFKLAKLINSQSFSRKIFKQVHDRFGGSIKYLVSGGAALPDETNKDLTTLGFEILEGYGMTETAPMISFTNPGNTKIGSVGFIVPGIDVKIEDGEVVVKGRNVMQGYYKRKKETGEILKNNWLYTGDLGKIDKKGYLYITGRKKEIIVTPGGKNINPIEIEEKILNMQKNINEIGVFLKDNILQAVIFPDFRKIKEQGILNLDEFFRWDVIDKYNKTVAPYKKIVKFSLVNTELPKTRLGKIRRFMLDTFVDSDNKSKKKIKEPKFEEYKIIKNYLTKVSELDVYPTDHIEIDLGLDSLDKVSFLNFLLSTFGVEVKEDELMKYSTVRNLAEYINSKKCKIEEVKNNWSELLNKDIEIELPRSSFLHVLIFRLLKLTALLFFRIKKSGLDYLPDSPYILVANHQSFLDALLVSMFLRKKTFKKTYFFAKEKHFGTVFHRFVAKRANIILMDINKDLTLSLQKVAEVLKHGNNAMIFPEGTRSRDGELGRFKKSFAILSRELNVPIVPVVIKGAYKALSRHSFIPRIFSKIGVEYLAPVFPENLNYEDLSNKVRDKMLVVSK